MLCRVNAGVMSTATEARLPLATSQTCALSSVLNSSETSSAVAVSWRQDWKIISNYIYFHCYTLYITLSVYPHRACIC